MDARSLYLPLKVFGYVVLLLVGAALIYAAYISIKYWPGIGV